jgi:putative FmdB family regulatory protein
MPIFEYKCQECGAKFEKLVLKPAADVVECPKCGTKRIEQQISSFISPVPGRHKAPLTPHPEYPDGPLSTHHDD